jgi:hypothetical protein
MFLLYFGLPEGEASASKHVADFKIYIQFVIILCAFVDECDCFLQSRLIFVDPQCGT